MKAMILCAGLGTRLRPLTERWPKPAVPLLGQPLLRYTLGLLERAGISEVGINSHHLPRVMEQVALEECESLGLKLHCVREEVIQGTGGGIRGLKSFLQDDEFVVFNGDILFCLNLPQIIEQHRASKAVATMVLLPMPEGEKFAAVEMTPGAEVRRIAGHGPGGGTLLPWHFSGVHIMTPAVFDFMSTSGPEDINREVYVRLIEAGAKLHGAVAQGYWSDLGTPSRYLTTQQQLLYGQVPCEHFGRGSPFAVAIAESYGFRHPTARVEGKVSGPAYFCEGVLVPPSARVGAGVCVDANVHLPERAAINRSTVFQGTTLVEGERLEDVLAFESHRIGAA